MGFCESSIVKYRQVSNELSRYALRKLFARVPSIFCIVPNDSFVLSLSGESWFLQNHFATRMNGVTAIVVASTIEKIHAA